MAGVVHVPFYATVFRGDKLEAMVAEIAPIALRYGATEYRVHVSNDDRYKITQMTWVPDHESWYSYWEGPEMVEFRARNSGRYQVPIVYQWMDEIVAGSLARLPEDADGEAVPASVSSTGSA